MTIQEFEDALDAWLVQAGPDDAVPAQLREEALQSLEKSDRLREWVWLHRETRRRRIHPPVGFADRVMQRLAEAPITGRRQSLDILRWTGAAIAVAAALVLAVLLRSEAPTPNDAGPIAKLETPKAPEVDITLPTTVSDTLSLPGVSQLALVLETPTRVLPSASLAASNRPQMRAIIGESADVLRTAGSELGQDMQPVALSAVGAFRFLWDESDSSPRKPST